MRSSTVLRILFWIILVAGVVGLGVLIYNAGVAQGLATSSSVVTPNGEGLPQPYFYPPFYRPWGFGLFWPVFPLLFFLLILLAVRGLFFRSWRRHGPWNWYGTHDHGERSIPPMVEEWHRRMHEAQSEQTQPQE